MKMKWSDLVTEEERERERERERAREACGLQCKSLNEGARSYPRSRLTKDPVTVACRNQEV